MSIAISLTLLAVIAGIHTTATNNRGIRELEQADQKGQWWIPGYEKLQFKALVLAAAAFISALLIPSLFSVDWINRIPFAMNVITVVIIVGSNLAHKAHYRLEFSHQSPADGTRQQTQPAEQIVINYTYIVACVAGVIILVSPISF